MRLTDFPSQGHVQYGNSPNFATDPGFSGLAWYECVATPTGAVCRGCCRERKPMISMYGFFQSIHMLVEQA